VNTWDSCRPEDRLERSWGALSSLSFGTTKPMEFMGFSAVVLCRPLSSFSPACLVVPDDSIGVGTTKDKDDKTKQMVKLSRSRSWVLPTHLSDNCDSNWTPLANEGLRNLVQTAKP
jgi:hypothetical protein